jgi:hypothetical protein
VFDQNGMAARHWRFTGAVERIGDGLGAKIRQECRLSSNMEPRIMKMVWEMINDDVTGVTERMAFAGGYLVRTSWRHPRGLGNDPLAGSAVVWVNAAAMPFEEKADHDDDEEEVKKVAVEPAKPEPAKIGASGRISPER